MTNGLKALLQHFGALSVAVTHLLSERPGSKHSTLEDYYKTLGPLLPDEPVLVVKVSQGTDSQFLWEGEHQLEIIDETGAKSGAVTIMELPEDEFWFFRAFRPTLFDLDKDLPPFIYEMSIVNAYAMFEAYLSDLLRTRLHQHPRLMGSQREIKYDQIFAAASKEEIVEAMIEREIRDLMYLPLPGLMKKMRHQLGFRALTEKHDEAVNYWSIVRNCLVHNQARADSKLAHVQENILVGDGILLNIGILHEAIRTLRKAAYEIDKSFEQGL